MCAAIFLVPSTWDLRDWTQDFRKCILTHSILKMLDYHFSGLKIQNNF